MKAFRLILIALLALSLLLAAASCKNEEKKTDGAEETATATAADPHGYTPPTEDYNIEEGFETPPIFRDNNG